MKLLAAVLLLCLLAVKASGEVEAESPLVQLLEQALEQDLQNAELSEDLEGNRKRDIEIVGGIIVGAFRSHLSLIKCFDDGKAIFTDLRKAHSELEHYHKKKNVEHGLLNLGHALKKLPVALKHCRNARHIIAELRHVALVFSNPESVTVIVGKNILWHGVSIYHQIKGMVSTFKHHQWFKFGEHIGSIIDKVVLKMENVDLPELNPGSEILEGFAHGISPSTYEDVSTCIASVSKDEFERIKEDVHDLSWKHVERSIKDIQDIGKVFVEAVKNCKTAKKSTQELIHKMSSAFTSDHFIEAAKKIIKNPLKFAKMVDSIHNDFKKKKYFVAGDTLGEFVADALNLSVAPIEEMLKDTV